MSLAPSEGAFWVEDPGCLFLLNSHGLAIPVVWRDVTPSEERTWGVAMIPWWATHVAAWITARGGSSLEVPHLVMLLGRTPPSAREKVLAALSLLYLSGVSAAIQHLQQAAPTA